MLVDADTTAAARTPTLAPSIVDGPSRPDIAAEEFVFQAVSRWADRTPEKLALLSGDCRYTYAQLEIESNRLARALAMRGIGPGDRVALILPRGPETILAILGTLKCGAAYVPLDTEMPAERIQMCLEDAAAQLIVAAANHGFEPDDVPAVTLDNLIREASTLSSELLDPTTCALSMDDLAYVIFTSGTTGRPKGVPISHRSLTNFVRGNQEACICVQPNDRVFQGFSPSSDGHHEEVWPTFLAGATLVVATTDDVHSGPELGAFLDHHCVTIISCAPTLLSMVEHDVPSLRRVLFGAERCPEELVRRWWKPGRTILNTYGPTEATVGTTFAECLPGVPVTIGRPLPNYYCYILDENQDPIMAGSEGELCISGVSVSSGYLNAAANAGRFVPNPFASPGHRNDILYRTGDRAVLNAQGQIEWRGRIDSQVKIRGHRIELSDIETHLLRDESVRSAAVVVREPTSKSPRLAALLVPKSGKSIDLERLLSQMRQEVPSYMVPQVFEEVDSLPALPSGKIDRKRVDSLTGRALTIERRAESPRTPTERLIHSLWCSLFGLESSAVSRTDDFFLDLGGHSLLAAQFISTLRTEHGMAEASVRDIYRHSRLDALAAHLDTIFASEHQETPSVPPFAPVPRLRYAIATLLQGLGILFLFGFRACFWLAPVVAAGYAVWLDWSPVESVLAGLLVHMVSVPFGLGVVAAMKWLVLGRVRPGKYPIWGSYFLRWWFVQRALDVAPRVYITGTPLAGFYLRMLGARVGRNVVIESFEMDCPDVISIGDDCVLEERSWVRASTVAHGCLTIRPISIGRGCIVGVRSGVAGGAVMGEGAVLADLSCAGEGTVIPPDEEWAGSPAARQPLKTAPRYDPSKQPSRSNLFWFGAVQVGLVLLMPLIDMIPFLAAALHLYQGSDEWTAYLFSPVYAVLILFAVCAQLIAVKWLVVGRIKPGTYAAPSWFYIRKWFVDKLLEIQTAVIVPVYDTLYTRPWCISMGMKCGPRSEIAMPARLPFDLVELGAENFLCSDCAVGMPVRRNGIMILEKTVTEPRVFLGNDSVIRQGTRMPRESLLGALSASPAQEDLDAAALESQDFLESDNGNARVGVSAQGQVWLGSPAFKLPEREHYDKFAAEETYRPTGRLYAERLIHEMARIVFPTTASLVFATLMLNGFDVVWESRSLPVAVLTTPLLDLAAAIAATLLLLAMKRILIGKYRPAMRPLWSRFVWKTESFAMFFHDFVCQLFVSSLMGTPYMAVFLRLMGAKVGRRAFIDTCDLTEFDLLSIGEDAAINFNAPLQAHLFEDRVMKLGHIRIGDRCSVGTYSVILFGSELKNDSHVGHISLVMKGETIPSGTYWSGSPAQARRAETLPTAPDESAASSLLATDCGPS